MDNIAIARSLYDAYATGDPSALYERLAPDLQFFSPPDPGIDRATYFERCWPNAHRIQSYEFVRLIASGDEVVVSYEAATTEGTRFRNTEVLTFRDDQVIRVEVYFGWNL
jgi:ketosteroid isomerase-like protein